MTQADACYEYLVDDTENAFATSSLTVIKDTNMLSKQQNIVSSALVFVPGNNYVN